MKNNRSAATLNLTHSLSVKQVTSPHNRKLEGFDNTSASSTFTAKIDRLKNKPKAEAVEEQYIRGLQDEIKYLEMELKLLQEKDIEKHGQIDQLEKVPQLLCSFLEMEYPSMRISLLSRTASTTTRLQIRRR